MWEIQEGQKTEKRKLEKNRESKNGKIKEKKRRKLLLERKMLGAASAQRQHVLRGPFQLCEHSTRAHKLTQLLQHTSVGWKQHMINSEHNTFCRKDLTSNSALTAPSISTLDWLH